MVSGDDDRDACRGQSSNFRQFPAMMAAMPVEVRVLFPVMMAAMLVEVRVLTCVCHIVRVPDSACQIQTCGPQSPASGVRAWGVECGCAGRLQKERERERERRQRVREAMAVGG